MGGGGSSTTVQKADPWGPAQPYLIEGMEAASNLFNTGGFEMQPYGGPRVAPQSDLTLAGQANIASRALGGSPVTEAATKAITGAVDMDQQYRGMDTVRQNVMDTVLPQVNQQFAAQGMTGSSLHSDAAARAATEALANVEYGAYDNAQNRAIQAASLAPEMEKSGYLGGMMLNQAGMQQDAYSQRLTDAQRAFFEESQRAPVSALQNYSGLLQGYGGQGGTSTSSDGYNPGAMDFVSAGMSMLPFLFMSDRRTKTDIERLGTHPNGVGIYSFRYRGDEALQIGVMADEVEKVDPAAVVELGGIKHVNYGRL